MLTSKILTYELKHWIKQPVFGIFLILFFCAGLGMMAFSADIFGESVLSQNTTPFANASSSIFSYFFDIQIFSLFLIPLFLCGTIYRDFQSNTYLVMYSYPFSKTQYISGKFISGFILVIMIQLSFCIGLFTGSIIPGVNETLIGGNIIQSYAFPFLSISLVNTLWIGILTFSIVLLSRSIHTGFVTVILLFVLRRVILFVFSGPDNISTITVIDPFGEFAVLSATSQWTISEINSQTVPLTNTFLLNRLLWTGFSLVIGLATYFSFNPTHSQSFFSFLKSSKKTQKFLELSFEFSQILPKGIRSIWQLSSFQFRSIIKSKTFIVLMVVSLLFMFLLLGQVNPEYTTRIYPLTQILLLIPSLFFSFIVMIVTFLYAGFLVNKNLKTGMNTLVDSTQVANHTLLFSRLFTLLKLQAVLLSLIIIGGVSVQLWKGYTLFEWSLYFFHVYGILFISLAIWASMSLFVQTVLKNQYLGFFLLVVFAFGLTGIDSIGIEKDIFAFNEAPIPQYSDLSGYGASLRSFFAHKFYWALVGGILLVGTLLLTRRGFVFSIKERFQIAIDRFSGKISFLLLLLSILFVGTGFSISSFVYPKDDMSTVEIEKRKVVAEIEIGHLKDMPQPRLKGVQLNIDLYPDERSYTSNGTLFFVNEGSRAIDTLLFSYPNDVTLTGIQRRTYSKIFTDSVLRVEVLTLSTPLLPYDTLKINFSAFHKPDNWFSEDSKVINNGTFFLADFPIIGYPELVASNSSNKSIPSDSDASSNSYIGKHIDLLDTDITVSTALNQTAFAPGKLTAQWTEKNRVFFRYVSSSPIRNGFPIQSGIYNVFNDSLNDIQFKIYHHPTHAFNLDRMMEAMKTTFSYADSSFGSYPFEELRIVEFSRFYGNFAQSFSQTIPFSEFAGFFSRQDSSENRFDDVFRLTAHETAHQWWGHQIIPADVLGSRFLTESFAELTALNVLEQQYGPEKSALYLETIKTRYFRQRNRSDRESQLVLVAPEETNVSYARGLLALNSMYEHLGKETFNRVLRNFISDFAFQEAPYPTSYDFITQLKSEIPDSLTYLIYDLFETSTVYKNEVKGYSSRLSPNNEFEIEFQVIASKERKKSVHQDTELIPNDENISGYYLQIGAYDSDDKLISLSTVRVEEGENSLNIRLPQKPFRIVLDPHHILIEQNISDNTLIIE